MTNSLELKTILHDISIYGKVVEYSSANLEWVYEELKGKMLFSKHFLTEDGYSSDDITNAGSGSGSGSSSNDINLLTRSVNCNNLCLYCTFEEYCISSTLGALLDLGTCTTGDATSTNINKAYADDREREYKRIGARTELEMCFEAVSNKKQCKDCVEGAVHRSDGFCYSNCESEYYYDSGKCEKCGDNCVECSSLAVCSKCKPDYYVKNDKCVRMICGDGLVVQKGDTDKCPDCEECDDGNNFVEGITDPYKREGDGCSPDCKIELGWRCTNDPYSTRTLCKPNECGDSFINPEDPEFENCDDGNLKSGDGCSSICRKERGYFCPLPGEECKLVCTNDKLDSYPGPPLYWEPYHEECDDGPDNLVSGDGNLLYKNRLLGRLPILLCNLSLSYSRSAIQ